MTLIEYVMRVKFSSFKLKCYGKIPILHKGKGIPVAYEAFKYTGSLQSMEPAIYFRFWSTDFSEIVHALMGN